MFPFRRLNQNDQGGCVSPEEVLLQVTLAFTVVLGFLLSDENAFNASLGNRLAQAEQVYGELQAASKDTLVEQVDQAVENAERMRLLNAWLGLRSEHLLFRRVQNVEESDNLLASLSPQQLLSEPLFVEMRDEVERLYGSAQQSDEPTARLAEEISSLTGHSIVKAGYRIPQRSGDLPAWLSNTKPVRAMNFLERHGRVQARIASWDNIRFLVDEIHSDFWALRRRVARVQLRAVMRLAEGKAAQEPQPGVSSDARRSLTDLLDEFETVLKLLPEVRQQLESTP